MAEVAMPNSPLPTDGSNGAETSNGSADIVTVFHDANNFNVKHPLANTWTLWFTKPPTGKGDNWNDLLKEVISFDSVEEFWAIYNNITPTSELPSKTDYHLFKQGVRPEWEDPQNKHGGKWAYTTKERKGVPIDDLWLHVVLAAIGETLEDDNDDEVMGVVVNVRKAFYRVGLWTRSNGGPNKKAGSTDGRADVLNRIGARLKEAMGLPVSEQVEFTGHSDSAHSGSTRARAKYTV